MMTQAIGQQPPSPDPGLSPLRRAAVALPDACAAAIFLWVWIAPPVSHPGVVGLLVLALMVEFVVMQAGPFLGTVVYGERLGLDRRQRFRTAGILATSYLVFAGLAAASFGAWFPALLFVWLFGAKLWAAVVGRRADASGREREMTYWVVSVGLYFAAIFLTMFVPVAPLGVTLDGAAYGLRGRYEWANFPHEAIAAGFLYFSLLAVLRAIDLRATTELST